MAASKDGKSFDDRSKSMNVSHRGLNGNVAKPTMTTSIKTKYIVRSRHNELTTSRFIPVNKSQAKSEVKKETIHDAGQPKRIDYDI